MLKAMTVYFSTFDFYIFLTFKIADEWTFEIIFSFFIMKSSRLFPLSYLFQKNQYKNPDTDKPESSIPANKP